MVNLVDFAEFIFEQAFGKFAVSGVKTVLKNLALIPVAGIIHPA